MMELQLPVIAALPAWYGYCSSFEDMTTQITIYPEAAYDRLSPYQEARAQAPEISGSLWGADGMSFKDVLDTINPLQQIPGISTAYRALTGDTISSGSRLIGGALLGGPIGFAVALLNEVVQSVSGKDIGANMIANANGEEENAPKEYAYAPPPTNRSAYEAYQIRQSMLG